MIKKKYIISTILLSLLCMNKTYAACTQEEINEFKKIENQFKVTYEFNKTTNDYHITIYNPAPNDYAYTFKEDLNHMKYESGDGGTLTFSGIKSGTYETIIIGLKECTDDLKTITFKLPELNKYYQDPLCEGIDEFVLCQPTYSKEIDYETFKSRVETYKKTKKNKEQTKKEEVTEENKILDYIKDNIYSIIIITVFVILVSITTIITAKSIRKSRRLE